jgi:hypothetical protein
MVAVTTPASSVARQFEQRHRLPRHRQNGQ